MLPTECSWQRHRQTGSKPAKSEPQHHVSEQMQMLTHYSTPKLHRHGPVVGLTTGLTSNGTLEPIYGADREDTSDDPRSTLVSTDARP
jgi:hypothetical protein